MTCNGELYGVSISSTNPPGVPLRRACVHSKEVRWAMLTGSSHGLYLGQRDCRWWFRRALVVQRVRCAAHRARTAPTPLSALHSPER
jgi:hypothetical protein